MALNFLTMINVFLRHKKSASQDSYVHASSANRTKLVDFSNFSQRTVNQLINFEQTLNENKMQQLN